MRPIKTPPEWVVFLLAPLVGLEPTTCGLTVRLPFAVPEKIIGLTHSLDFFDRGTHCALAASATGSARARGHLRRYAQSVNNAL